MPKKVPPVGSPTCPSNSTDTRTVCEGSGVLLVQVLSFPYAFSDSYNVLKFSFLIRLYWDYGSKGSLWSSSAAFTGCIHGLHAFWFSSYNIEITVSFPSRTEKCRLWRRLHGPPPLALRRTQHQKLLSTYASIARGQSSSLSLHVSTVGLGFRVVVGCPTLFHLYVTIGLLL